MFLTLWLLAPIDFNPRSYKRSDLLETHHRYALKISIHAPTRGATTMRKGTVVVCLEFQSTLLQEERLVQTVVHFYCNFISIHAPTRGATNRLVLIDVNL